MGHKNSNISIVGERQNAPEGKQNHLVLLKGYNYLKLAIIKYNKMDPPVRDVATGNYSNIT